LKGLVLAAVLIAGWVVAQGLVLHALSPRKAFASMVWCFAPTLPAYLALYWWTPADLGVLAPATAGTPFRLGPADGLVVQGLLFLTGVLFYYHADRSITVRLLIELARAPEQRMSLAEMQAVCGLDVLMRDRLDTMVLNRFLVERGGRYHLAPKGW